MRAADEHSDRHLLLPILAMMTLVGASNYLVQFAFSDWLTWAAFTYPVTFLVTDMTNRRLGAGPARRVVYAGFVLGVVLSAILAPWRIAVASGSAFLVAQLLDVKVFDRLRHLTWWRAPLFSSTVGSAVDTALFFAIAFMGTPVPWVTLATGDFAVKMAMALLMLAPFRVLMIWVAARS